LVVVLHFLFISADLTPKTWIVDLDKPPAERWPIAQMYPNYIDAIKGAIGLIDVFIPKELQNIVYQLALETIPHLGIYGDEIKAAAEFGKIPLEKAVLLNIIYEAEAGCTSIVAQQNDNTIIHGRNLDFPLTSYLRNLTINVLFQKSGKTLYNGVSYAGYVGLLTGMRPGAFAISANERIDGFIWENFLEAILVPGTYASAFLIRDTLEQTQTFEDAVYRLSTTPLAAPIYLTVSGVKSGEGAIITRNRNYPEDIWRLDPSNGRWFLAETNDDHWKPPEDNRRDAANNSMKSIGRGNMTLDGLFTVLKKQPVYNTETTYTTVMCSKTGFIKTQIADLDS